MNGDDFLRIAGKLAAGASPDEAACRTAVNRAYYGVLHLALSLMRDLGVPVPANAAAHAKVRHYLIGSNQADAATAGTKIGLLYTEQIRADYHLDKLSRFDLANVRLHVASAHDIRSSLEKCRTAENRDEVMRVLAVCSGGVPSGVAPRKIATK